MDSFEMFRNTYTVYIRYFLCEESLSYSFICNFRFSLLNHDFVFAPSEKPACMLLCYEIWNVGLGAYKFIFWPFKNLGKLFRKQTYYSTLYSCCFIEKLGYILKIINHTLKVINLHISFIYIFPRSELSRHLLVKSDFPFSRSLNHIRYDNIGICMN